MSPELPVAETHFPLYAEDLTVSKRQIPGDVVQVDTITRENECFVDETLNHKRVQIDRIPVGRQVDAVPPIRQEGDTTVLSVVEETVVVERPPYSERRNPYPASICVGAAPGSCDPAEAGGSDHSHRALQRGTSGEIDA
jgi:hypothetical protein